MNKEKVNPRTETLTRIRDTIKKYIKNRRFTGAYVELKKNILHHIDYIFECEGIEP